MAKSRKYDVVLFGASGYTGQLTAEYLARRGGERLRWALAGRNADKLEALRARLIAQHAGCRAPDLVIADSDDPPSLSALARSGRVVISTVGPYLLHGAPLVAACAREATDYLDLCGEPEFVDRMWVQHHETARASGARIVHCCGFDSVPHDLGCWFTVQQLPEDVPLRVQGFVRAGGTISGGTLHSAMLALSRLGAAGDARRERLQREGRLIDRRIGALHHGPRYLPALGGWALPLPTIDPLIVRRSAAALDRYGPDFRYGHYAFVRRLSSLAMLAGGVSAVLAGAQFRGTREQLLRWRRSGEGPSPDQRDQGWFKIVFLGEGGGRRVRCEVAGGDPGYGETAKMLAESALSLAFDRLPRTAGCVTPAQAFGDALLGRLQRAGIRFDVVEKT